MITTFIEREAEPILINDLTWREFKAVEQMQAFVKNKNGKKVRGSKKA